jgi:meso-butanediol dehydrogenase/(S,S)-butanediol dehydrogenase/diacetyl reductase
MVLQIPARFEGKVVAITGGASGVGAAMTRRYIAEGAFVLIADMCERAKGDSFVAELEKGKAFFHQVDISDTEGATTVVTEAIKQFGTIDVVHNNASAFAWGTIPDMDPEQWTKVFNVGVNAPFHICRAALTEMRKKGSGSIVNTISTSGLGGDQGLGCYCAAKAALANLTKAMGTDHAREGIRVNAIAPGWIDTPMSAALSATPEVRELVASSTPMHRPGSPEEIAAVAMFLASEDASFVTGSGMSPSFRFLLEEGNACSSHCSLERRWRSPCV